MDILRFRKGFKNWDTTFEVKLNCEYTPDSKKKISSITFYKPDVGKKFIIPWHVFKQYLNDENTAFVSPQGFAIKKEGNKITVNNSKGFELVIHEDQCNAIKLTAKRLEENL